MATFRKHSGSWQALVKSMVRTHISQVESVLSAIFSVDFFENQVTFCSKCDFLSELFLFSVFSIVSELSFFRDRL